VAGDAIQVNIRTDAGAGRIKADAAQIEQAVSKAASTAGASR